MGMLVRFWYAGVCEDVEGMLNYVCKRRKGFSVCLRKEMMLGFYSCWGCHADAGEVLGCWDVRR